MKDKIRVLIFILLIFIITISSIFSRDRLFSENENRYLASKPKFSFESLKSGTYGKEYEEYISDQFIFRDSWIGIKTLTERTMLKQEINGVYFGKDGYLIESHKDINEEQFEKNLYRLKEFVEISSEIFGKENVKVMIVPTAGEILRDKLPYFAYRNTEDNLINKVKSEFVLKSGYEGKSNFTDVRQNLKKHNNEYIYYKTDHHWTSLGAYYAYEIWAKECGFIPYSQKEFNIETVSEEFYGTIYSKVNSRVNPDSIKIYEKPNMEYVLKYNLEDSAVYSLYDLDKLKGKDKYSVFLGGNNALVNIKTNIENERKLLIIKDSFSHSFVPFVANHFSEIAMIDLRYFNKGAISYINEEDFTDVLILYNSINFSNDNNFSKLLK